MKVDNMTINEMLEKRHEVYLEWHEPRPGISSDGNEVHANVTLSATVHDCINMSRAVFKHNNLKINREDIIYLLDFFDLHYPKAKELT